LACLSLALEYVPEISLVVQQLTKSKLNARLALRQRADLFKANISANKTSLPQGQSYTEGKCYNGSKNSNYKKYTNGYD